MGRILCIRASTRGTELYFPKFCSYDMLVLLTAEIFIGSFLVLDSFRGHLTDMVKETFRKSEIDIAVIPGGLTSKLQPLDVMINHSFKAKVSKLLFAVLRFTFTIYNSSFILLLTVASQSV